MLTRSLLGLLDRAESPRTVRMLDWALRKSTGDPFYASISTGFDYDRRGFYGIAALLGGNPSYSGRSINRETSLDCSALYAGTKLICEDLGALPFHTYERASNGNVDRATKHPLYRALHDLANPDISAGELVESLTSHAILTGTGYAEIQRLRSGTYLWPLQPEKMRIDKNKDGRVIYLYDSDRKTYKASEIFSLKGFTTDGICGESLLRRGRNTLGISASADEYVGRFFAADAAPGVVISRPATAQRWSKETVEEVKKQWKEWHQGVSRSHEVAILQDGATVSRISQSNQEMQLLELRKNQVIEVCMLLRLPPHKLAQLDRATFSNIEHQGIEYITNTLNPWISRWKRAVYRCLLTEDEQLAGNIWAEHDVAGLLRGDFAAQTEGFRKLLEKGVYTINEVRKLLGFNAVNGGDENLVQLNLSTIQSIAEGLNLPNSLPMKVGANAA